MRLFQTAIACAWLAASAFGQPAEEWLPDLTVDPAFLRDYAVVDEVEPGRVHLRLSNATPNLGLGPLYVYGLLPANPDGSQDVMQRVFLSDGSYYDVPAGRFIFHPEHNHIHLEDWAVYRLRMVLPDGGVGTVVAEGAKTSYCLRDSKVYTSDLAHFHEEPVFNECEGTIQGISVGYEDVYTKELPDQWIDVTDLPRGTYWLESEVDPGHHILESDETNNVARARVQVGPPDRPLYYLRFALVFYLVQLLNVLRSLLGLPPVDLPGA